MAKHNRKETIEALKADFDIWDLFGVGEAVVRERLGSFGSGAFYNSTYTARHDAGSIDDSSVELLRAASESVAEPITSIIVIFFEDAREAALKASLGGAPAYGSDDWDEYWRRRASWMADRKRSVSVQASRRTSSGKKCALTISVEGDDSHEVLGFTQAVANICRTRVAATARRASAGAGSSSVAGVNADRNATQEDSEPQGLWGRVIVHPIIIGTIATLVGGLLLAAILAAVARS